MTRLLVIGCELLVASCGQPERVVLKGQLTTDSIGVLRVAECEAGRQLRLGVMASNPYFIFRRKYDELSARGTKPVLIQVSGVLIESSSSRGELTLETPGVISMTNGQCDA